MHSDESAAWRRYSNAGVSFDFTFHCVELINHKKHENLKIHSVFLFCAFYAFCGSNLQILRFFSSSDPYCYCRTGSFPCLARGRVVLAERATLRSHTAVDAFRWIGRLAVLKCWGVLRLVLSFPIARDLYSVTPQFDYLAPNHGSASSKALSSGQPPCFCCWST
jgi:hypothetical protein